MKARTRLFFIPKLGGPTGPSTTRNFVEAGEKEDGPMSTVNVAVAHRLPTAAAPTTVHAPAARAEQLRRRKADRPQTTRLNEFADLYNQYFPKVFAYVYGRVQDKEVSLDIVSDVFEKAFIKVQSLRSPESFGSWLFTIARNEVSSHWRKEKPAARAAQAAAWENEIHNQPRGPEETILHKERLHALSLLVRQLPKREQEIIALKFDGEL